MTAPGVCGKTYYSNKASRETIVLNREYSAYISRAAGCLTASDGSL